MTPQERQLIDDLFDRLSKLESAPRDPEAMAAITQGLRKAPNAVYALVQTVLVQDEALRQAHDRIEALEASAGAPEQRQSGGFLDSMRDAIFGQDHTQGREQDQSSRGSVPNVPPRDMSSRNAGSRPVWNSGQVMPGAMPRGQYQEPQYNQGQYNQGQYGQPQYGQPYGAPQNAPMGGGLMGGGFGGGGGSFLGTAAATAAGMVGGSLLLNSFRGMMGGSRQGFGDTVINEKVINENPWSDQSRGSLARDAGVNDVGSRDPGSQDLAAQDRAQDLEQDREDDSNSRSGLFDSASNNDDHDDMDMDSDDFGNDGNSDYA
jgi:hypothetical protein